MNSDSPTLPVTYLTQAFVYLDRQHIDVVLGPCLDGGYYLIGWKRNHPQLVAGVEMSTSHVLQDTLRVAFERDLRVGLLPSWRDVDNPHELGQLSCELRQEPGAAPFTARYLATIAASGTLPCLVG